MDPILPQPALSAPLSLSAPLPLTMPPVSAIPSLWQQDRIARITALAPEDAVAGLLWLAMNFPAIVDAMLDKVEYDAIEDPDPAREPGPFCAECDSEIGIFLRFGLNWRHFRGDGTIIGQIELFDPGHEPVVAWRLTRAFAIR
jgi:hypothetical protein